MESFNEPVGIPRLDRIVEQLQPSPLAIEQGSTDDIADVGISSLEIQEEAVETTDNLAIIARAELEETMQTKGYKDSPLAGLDPTSNPMLEISSSAPEVGDEPETVVPALPAPIGGSGGELTSASREITVVSSSSMMFPSS